MRTGFLTYGQSLSFGTGTGVAYSTSQPYSNLTFLAGVRTELEGPPGVLTAEKPLVEESNGVDRTESICSCAANYAVERAMIENGILPQDFSVFAACAGAGGAAIADLMPGTANYQKLLERNTAAEALAHAAGQEYRLGAIAWLQGESDGGATFDYYLEKFLALTEAMPGPTLTYQTATYTISPANGGVARAQARAAEISSKVKFCTPVYQFPYSAGGVHLEGLGYAWAGKYFGRAFKQLVIDKRTPDYIRPLSAVVMPNRTDVVVYFSVPTSPLRLDDDIIGEATDWGFKIKDDSGDLTIASMAVGAGGTSVEITLSDPLGANGECRYGLDYLGTGLNIHNGASGNLYDSTADTAVIDGNVVPLNHFCQAFLLPIVALDPSNNL